MLDLENKKTSESFWIYCLVMFLPNLYDSHGLELQCAAGTRLLLAGPTTFGLHGGGCSDPEELSSNRTLCLEMLPALGEEPSPLRQLLSQQRSNFPQQTAKNSPTSPAWRVCSKGTTGTKVAAWLYTICSHTAPIHVSSLSKLTEEQQRAAVTMGLLI